MADAAGQTPDAKRKQRDWESAKGAGAGEGEGAPSSLGEGRDGGSGNGSGGVDGMGACQSGNGNGNGNGSSSSSSSSGCCWGRGAPTAAGGEDDAGVELVFMGGGVAGHVFGLEEERGEAGAWKQALAQSSPSTTSVRGFIAAVSSTRGDDMEQVAAFYDTCLQRSNYRLPVTRKRRVNPQEKTEIMDRVRTDWQSNELAWRQSQQDQEEGCQTRCVRTKLGGYEYFDKATDAPVPPEEYQARYESFLLRSKLRAGGGGSAPPSVPSSQVQEPVAASSVASTPVLQSTPPAAAAVAGAADKENAVAVVPSISGNGNGSSAAAAAAAALAVKSPSRAEGHSPVKAAALALPRPRGLSPVRSAINTANSNGSAATGEGAGVESGAEVSSC